MKAWEMRATVSGWANVHVCIYLSPQSSQGLPAPSAEDTVSLLGDVQASTLLMALINETL